MTEEPAISLLPPPLLLPHGDLPPIVEPSLRGHPPDLGPTPEQVEPFQSEPVTPGVDEETLRAVSDLVLAHEPVARTITKKRYAIIGASLREGKETDRREAIILAVLYNYTDNVAIEVSLDEGRNVQMIREVSEQPPPVQQELDEAISLARSDNRLSPHLTHDMVGTAILVSPVDPLAPDFNHRQLDVRFGDPTERVPHLAALVDLSTRTVVTAGPITGRERADAEGDEE